MKFFLAIILLAASAPAYAEEGKKTENPPEGWVCKIVAKGNTYVGAGDSKAVAEAKAYESCKETRRGDYFCKEFSCESNRTN